MVARARGCSPHSLCTRPYLPLRRVFRGLRGFAPTGRKRPAGPLNPPAGGIAPPLLGGLGSMGGHAAPPIIIGHPPVHMLGGATLRPFRPIAAPAGHVLESSPRVAITPPTPPSGGAFRTRLQIQCMHAPVPRSPIVRRHPSPLTKRKRSKKRKGGRPPKVGQPSPLTTYILYGRWPCQVAPYAVYKIVVQHARLLKKQPF